MLRRRSRNPITGRGDNAKHAQKRITLRLICREPMSTSTGQAAGDKEPTKTQQANGPGGGDAASHDGGVVRSSGQLARSGLKGVYC